MIKYYVCVSCNSKFGSKSDLIQKLDNYSCPICLSNKIYPRILSEDHDAPLPEIKYNHGIGLGLIVVDRKTYFQYLSNKISNEEIRVLDKIPKPFLKHLLKRFLVYDFVTIGHDIERNNWAVSICSPKDNFSRKIGRQLVNQRLYLARDPKFISEMIYRGN